MVQGQEECQSRKEQQQDAGTEQRYIRPSAPPPSERGECQIQQGQQFGPMHRTHPDPFLSLKVFQLLQSEPNQTAGGDGKAQTELRPEIAESGSGAGEQG